MTSFYDLIKNRIQGKIPSGKKRHKGWRKLRREYIKKNPRCAICGLYKKVEVHHIVPFFLAPDLELNPENLVTLCENKKWGINCHLAFGHRGSYRDINPNVKITIAYMRAYFAKY